MPVGELFDMIACYQIQHGAKEKSQDMGWAEMMALR